MIQKERDNIVWLEFEQLQEFKKVKAWVFTRLGGVSSGEQASLNISLYSGDTAANVYENRTRIRTTIQEEIGACQPVFICEGRQMHQSEILPVSVPFTQDMQMGPCDALATCFSHCALLINHADCQATVLYDPCQHVIANVHCGWRGNVANIYSKAVQFLYTSYGSQPENIFACISPSLGPNKSEFINYQHELPQSFWDYQIKPFYFDLWEIARQQLIQCGILPHHIEIAQICTYERKEWFFSHRRNPRTGRHATLASLTF